MNSKINKIICSDWRDFIICIEDNSVDLVVTDPPYGMNFVSNHRQIKHKEIKDDDNLDWLESWSAAFYQSNY